MNSQLYCISCGASGEANFSKNEAGESVCNLCGTQSFLQSRNETQDYDDGIGQVTLKKAFSHRKRKARAVKAPKPKRELVDLENCLLVSQTILHHQAQALAKCTKEPQIVPTVRNLWFQFLHVWAKQSEVPLVNCYLLRGSILDDMYRQFFCWHAI